MHLFSIDSPSLDISPHSGHTKTRFIDWFLASEMMSQTTNKCVFVDELDHLNERKEWKIEKENQASDEKRRTRLDNDGIWMYI